MELTAREEPHGPPPWRRDSGVLRSPLHDGGMSGASDTLEPYLARRQPASGDAGGVLLYSESDLLLHDAPQRTGSLPGLVNELLAQPSSADRVRLVRRLLHGLGFEWLAYGTAGIQRGRAIPRSFLTTYGHPVWTEHYFRERYYEMDPRHYDAPSSSLPLVWDLDDIAASARTQPGSSRARRFLNDFGDSGIRSGVFFSVASPDMPHERTVISLMSSAPQRGWIVDSVLGQALTLGLSVHEFLSRHVHRSVFASGPRAELSALQRDILECLIGGQSDKQIAHRLSLSSHTVDYHLRQLRRRFSVRNRVQLVNAAIEAAAADRIHQRMQVRA
ncbi:LuxR family transcriptional regulator [Caldimonas brevitalea]|uniref:Transcriptional regulator n=1 Tax=Caldimonas brevitalea TaxID=413882 RepID=A0A0G3BK46_9BURK|nr:LuxR family transcriptional regulator [Caldimonas brevitalea]AKJ29819.1 transcriptional regulator [Caldimonas brevitalea]